MGKRLICIALVLILVTTIGLSPLAQPAEAVAGVVVAGAVVAVMAMAGITIVTSGMTAVQIQSWVEDKLDEWAADVGSPLDHLINSAGIGVTISGLLTIGTAAAQGISDFITWLKTELSLTNNDSFNIVTAESKIGNIRGFYGTYFKVYDNVTWQIATDVPVLFGRMKVDQSSNGYRESFAVSLTPFNFTLTIGSGSPSNGSGQLVSNGYYYGIVGGRSEQRGTDPPVPFNDFNVYTYLQNTPGLTLELAGSLDIDTGVIAIPQVQEGDKVFIDVGALPGSTVSEVTEGVITDVMTDTLDVSGTIAEEEPEYVITGPVSVSGLDDIFPFCIPFDLYHMLEALAADPVAPYFEWRFYVPKIVDYNIVIDLSGFNTVAQILRLMETLLFCVGLAFETRKLLRS